jgi:hypothetical protein
LFKCDKNLVKKNGVFMIKLKYHIDNFVINAQLHNHQNQ